MMSTTDEFIIDVDKVTNILTAKSHIEELFHVTLILGEEIKDDGKQWLEVRGNTQERKAAKEYILALCDSALLACLEYPLHMKNNFMDSKLCAQIERDSSVVLDFDKPGQIRIKGNDAVSVTQAYIALEDIISKLSGRDSKQPQGESCASVEIDSLDNKIKDVVLDVLLEKGNDQELSAYGIRKHIVNNVADNKTCFFSKEHEREVQHAKSLQEGDEQLKLCDLPKKQKVDSEKESNDPAHHFKQFALDNGYSEEKVENIFATFGRDVSFDVFYRALNDIVTPNDGSDSVNDISNETKRKGAGTTHPVSSNVFNQQKDSAKTSDMEPDKDSVIKQIISEEMLKYSSTVAKARNSEVIELSSDDDDDDHIDLTNDSSDSEHYSSVKRQTQENCMTALDQGRLQRQLLAFSQLAMPSNHGASLQPTTFVEAAAASCIPEGELRHVVIDGSNVAMTHGREKVFSCRGIELVVKYFKNRGHKNITAFVPQWRLINMSDRYPITDKYLLRSLQNDGFLVFTPARRVPGKNIACYDDRYILRLAHLVDGVIVSNDNYRDLWFEQPEWRGVIEKRLLMYSFVGDIFMPPDDPLGRDGPSLTDFLRKPSMQEQMPQPRIIPARPLMANAPMQQFRYGDSGSNSGKRNSSQVVQNPHSFSVPQAANWRHKDNPDGYACYQSRFTGQTSVSSEPMQPQGFNQVPIKQPRHMPPSGKVRDEACTQRLLTSLKEVFSDCAAIQRVLDENPTEENLNVLSDHVLNYMTN